VREHLIWRVMQKRPQRSGHGRVKG